MSKEFEDLLGQYWDLAHLEGKSGVSQGDKANEVLHALKKLAEQPAQQEPVAWMHWLHGPVRLFFNKDEAQMELERLNREYPVDVGSRKMRPLVFGDTSPPTLSLAQRKPLTDDQINNLDEWMQDQPFWRVLAFARAIEAAHGIKEQEQ